MSPDQQPVHHPSPPLGIVATISVLLFVASLAIGAFRTGGAGFPTPYDSIDLIRTYYSQYADVVRIMAMLQFGAAIPLGIFSAAVTSRLLFFGIRAAGVHITFLGGAGASLFLAISGLAGWVLSQPGIAAETGVLRALQLLDFVTGGVGHVTMLGLLVAGIAVTTGLTGWLPRWTMAAGLVLAILAELASFSLLFPFLSILLPISRFASYIWLIAVGFMLKTPRTDQH